MSKHGLLSPILIMFYVTFCLILLGVRTVGADHYLIVLQLPSGRHLLTTEAVLQSLTSRGHNVSLLIPPVDSADEERIMKTDSRVDLIRTYGLPGIARELVELKKTNIDMITSAIKVDQMRQQKAVSKIYALQDVICEALLSNTTLMNDLRRRDFDLLFADISFQCPILIAQSLGLQFTTLTTMVIPSWHAGPHRSPINPSYIPRLTTAYSDRMTFGQRLINTIIAILISIARVFQDVKSDVLKEKYDIMPNIPTYYSPGMAEIWFINSHFALEYSRPLVPRAILVGGLTAKEASHLNQVGKMLNLGNFKFIVPFNV